MVDKTSCCFSSPPHHIHRLHNTNNFFIYYILPMTEERNQHHQMESPQSVPIPSIDWSKHTFLPVIRDFPSTYTVMDFSQPNADAVSGIGGDWTIGKYDENRTIYTSDLFSDGRSLHVGLDIGAPVGTPVCAFMDGKIHSAGYNPAAGDYGHVIVTEHELDGCKFWALYGHLNSESSAKWKSQDMISGGDVLGWLGDKSENGGYFPHVHFQISMLEPSTHDLPGAVALSDRENALKIYPDPQFITGRFY